jgi:hypothetical protein
MSMQIRADQERRTAARHGRRLQYLTIAWNSAECLISIGAGIVAGSIALVGFGFDSAIESCEQPRRPVAVGARQG